VTVWRLVVSLTLVLVAVLVQTTIFRAVRPFDVSPDILLLMVIVAAVLIGGSGAWGKAGATGFLSFSSSGSYYFAIVLIIGIVASNAFHPGMWQRVYTVESQKSLNRSLWGATALAIPLTFLLGLAGIAAVGNGSVAPFAYPEVSAALFALASDLFPLWMHFLMLVCALMLAMSTLDTLMNGLASGLAADMAAVGVSRNALMLLARTVTAVVVIPAIIVASQGFSVLYVFLVADLSDLKGEYSKVAHELRHTFSLAYYSNSPSTQGGMRRVRVEVKDPSLRARTRTTYFVPATDRSGF